MIDASRALDPEHSHHAASRDHDRLVDLLRMWVLQPEPAQMAHVAMFDITARKQGVFDFIVNVDEEVAHAHTDRLDQVVAAVAREYGIDHAHREDREVLLLAAPTLSADQTKGLLDRIWQSLNP